MSSSENSNPDPCDLEVLRADARFFEDEGFYERSKSLYHAADEIERLRKILEAARNAVDESWCWDDTTHKTDLAINEALTPVRQALEHPAASTVTLYHVTREATAAAIMKDGFRDSTNAGKTGVWFAAPAIQNYKSKHGMADTVLAIEIPEELAKRYELRMTGDAFVQAHYSEEVLNSGSTEYCIPAEVVNQCRTTLRRNPATPS